MDIAITDNCVADRAALKNKIKEAAAAGSFFVGITEFESGEALLSAVHAKAFDLVFLDIYMDGIDGIETAERLRKLCPRCLIVFVTVSSDHAVEGFRVRALHYLVKPFTAGDIVCILKEAAARLGNDIEILVRDGGVPVHLPLSQIHYALCERHYILIHTPSGVIRWRQPFSKFCEILAPYAQFFVCNRGTLLNLGHVEKLLEDNDCFLMDDGTKLPIRQSSHAQARSRYLDHLFRTIKKEK
ncbi:LytR/AlgR family response regulator transcription factor [Christensenella timonensis]|uniref:LytR/AlgR family response regulator transcription factor n=1 Tax=Christensenella timonensis TaxID=1816678 RepID=UPI00082C5749|nr:LytTR family DNA-binding domain-containing protein [Christensenella timonensis]